MTGQTQIFDSLGIDLTEKKEMKMKEGWTCFSLNHNNVTKEIPVIWIKRGPKNISEVKKAVKGFSICIVLFAECNMLFLKAFEYSHTITLESDLEYERIASIIKSCDIADAKTELKMQVAIIKAIQTIPIATENFDNRGIFSTHYMRNRVFDDVRHDMDIDKIKQKIGTTPDEILSVLGWDISNPNETYYSGKASIVITDQDDFSIRKNDTDVAPSYIAVSHLKKSQWVILTNGKRWRLYTSKISASSTNYFEIVLDPERDSVTRYLIAVFGAKSFEQIDGKTDVDFFFEEGKKYATDLEEDLSIRIISANGLFLDLVKGVLNHDCKTIFSDEELESAKQASLKIMYRIWFVAYAESRNLLPTKDSKYTPISLQSIRTHLDSYQSNPDKKDCWENLLELFKCIRNGSVKHNLPQYSGDLFKHDPSIDNRSIKNEFITKALYDLLEKEGQSIDYASLSVRHLGSIFESLMEFRIRQADKDIMLLEDKKGVREVSTKQQSSYSYKKNDLYLITKGGIALRKTTASFYTPDKIVEFLVRRGLEPIFNEREKLIGKYLNKYQKTKSGADLQKCMDNLLDIQVLDPTMGSGHFLVEVLNKITTWTTDMLNTYPLHPLLKEIESDRSIVISEQKKKGINIDESLLTYDVLLKRKIMKRCIFGVDLNPMAVEIAKLSLWLDSFAIGVPLTYMDHHIKLGDSTIGMFLDDLSGKDTHTLDDWMPSAKTNDMICDVTNSSDITIKQVHASEDRYREYVESLQPIKRVLDALAASKINPKMLPKRSPAMFIHRFGRYAKDESSEFVELRRTVNELADRHRFFHWETEMMDAFTDKRRGFDLIVGNPPWEKMKPNNDEFFTPYDTSFRSLKPYTKKEQRVEELLHYSDIKNEYDQYKTKINEKNAFYTTYKIQGSGDKDLWKLIFERILNLVAKNGIVSMILPSQCLTNAGASEIRKQILEKDILSLYVFENRKKIFQIDSRYRFVFLSFCNREGQNEFPVGFYLHDIGSLEDASKEKEKFSVLSKKIIYDMSPTEYIIPETIGLKLDLLKKISQNHPLKDGLGNDWNVGLSRGFNKTNDADLLLDDGKGWPVFEGKNIHQFTQDWTKLDFTASIKNGLNRESTKRMFAGKHRQIYDSCRLVFRDISNPTNTRTVIAAIIPPHTFHINSLFSIVLTKNTKIITDFDYDKKISYLCGVFNSMTFDFTARTKIQLHMSTIIESLPIPNPYHEDRISKLSGMLVVGSPEFEGFAESLRVENKKLTPAQRIEVTAEIDVLVAHSYNLTKKEYETIIDSFNLFKKNPTLYDLEDIAWNNKNLKEFYGEVAHLSLEYYDEITKEVSL